MNRQQISSSCAAKKLFDMGLSTCFTSQWIRYFETYRTHFICETRCMTTVMFNICVPANCNSFFARQVARKTVGATGAETITKSPIQSTVWTPLKLSQNHSVFFFIFLFCFSSKRKEGRNPGEKPSAEHLPKLIQPFYRT